MGTLSPRLREEIARFDPEVEGISVAEFCRRHQISRSSFYRIQRRSRDEGLAAAMVPRSRAPRQPARRYGPLTVALVCKVHQELLAEAKEAGPWSVEFRLLQRGVTPLPSRSTIARIMRTQGLSQPSPRKRPRSSYQRFRRAHGNELWQLDGLAWQLPDGRLVTIYHLIDDHSRLCTAVVARRGGENAAGARAALQAGFDAFGMPQSVLSDNSLAFNQHRRGKLSSTEVWLAGLGIRPISGRVQHPQTQGKVERAHQSLLRWLKNRQPVTLEAVNDLLAQYQHWYNHERQHQALGHHLTPFQVWHGSAKLGPEPRPIPTGMLYNQPLHQPPPPGTHPDIGTRRVGKNAKFWWKGHIVQLGIDMSHQQVHLIHDAHQLEVYNSLGELHAAIPWPPPNKTISATRPPLRVSPKP